MVLSREMSQFCSVELSNLIYRTPDRVLCRIFDLCWNLYDG